MIYVIALVSKLIMTAKTTDVFEPEGLHQTVGRQVWTDLQNMSHAIMSRNIDEV
jgi:hypothetical protein